jgi:uncharacterized membrane protein YqhA
MKFNEKLVLNSYLLSLFGVDSFEDFVKELKDSRLEELDENDNSLFYHSLKDKLISYIQILHINFLKIKITFENGKGTLGCLLSQLLLKE